LSFLGFHLIVGQQKKPKRIVLMRAAKFSDLLQFEESEPIRDCVWADFLFQLGCRMAMAEPARVKILLVLPVIDIAAPLITFGYLYGRFNGISSGKLSIESFKELPPGTGLIFYSPTGPRRAVFEGIAECSGMECVRVRIESKEKGSGMHLLMPQQLNKISILPNAGQNTSERSVGKNIAGISDFAKQIYGAGNLENIAPILNSAWLVGRFGELEDELSNISLGAKKPGTSGNFADLIRADQFLKQGEPSFSCLISCYKQDADFAIPPSAARLTIFREGVSYLKHQHYYENASKVILMDFADRNCEAVIDAYNREYYGRSEEDWRFEFDRVPENVICAGYIEAGRA
jgi:hypothetical protein